jgi:hypothetical protein
MQQLDSKQAEIELSVIKQIMLDSRKAVLDNGKQLIFWGVLVSLALFINYIMLLNRFEGRYMGYMWLILMVAGAIISTIWEKNDIKKMRVKTFAGKLLGMLWVSSGIAMFIFFLVGMFTSAYNPIYICPIISTTLGVSYFTSGAIQQLKWMQMLAIGWWAGAVLMFIFPSIHTLLIYGLMMLLFQTLPGIILYRKWKSLSSEESSCS